jgi:hypothetical protein
MFSNKINYVIGIVCFAFSSNIFALDTVGYVKIKELKAWDTVVDVNLEGDQQHQCSGTLKTRFLADAGKNNHISFLLMAYAAGKTVSLKYTCNSNGHPEINGIRVRNF